MPTETDWKTLCLELLDTVQKLEHRVIMSKLLAVNDLQGAQGRERLVKAELVSELGIALADSGAMHCVREDGDTDIVYTANVFVVRERGRLATAMKNIVRAMEAEETINDPS